MEENIIVLADVERVEVDRAPAGTYLLMANNGNIKQLLLSQAITQHIDSLKTEIGTPADEYNNVASTGIYLKIDDTNTRVREINERIGNNSTGSNSATGICETIENLQDDVKDLQNIATFKGYQIELIGTDSSYTKNLIADKAEFTYDINITGEKVPSMSVVFPNNQPYLYELMLGLTYITPDNIELCHTVTFDLNTIYHTTEKKAAIQLPVTNTLLIFKFTLSGTTIKFTVSTSQADSVKDSIINLRHGVLKIHKMA